MGESLILGGVKTVGKMEMRRAQGCPLHDRSQWPDPTAAAPPEGTKCNMLFGRKHPLVYGEDQSKLHDPEYDVFRCKWCTTNRTAWTPPGFRSGTIKHEWFARLHGFKRTNKQQGGD